MKSSIEVVSDLHNVFEIKEENLRGVKGTSMWKTINCGPYPLTALNFTNTFLSEIPFQFLFYYRIRNKPYFPQTLSTVIFWH